MLSYFIVALCPGFLFVALLLAGDAGKPISRLIFGGYVFRFFFQYAARNFEFFSHVARADSQFYEKLAEIIARRWEYQGIYFVTGADLHEVGSAPLPVNIFALIRYINNDTATDGNCAIVMLTAAFSALIFYKLLQTLGVPERPALGCTAAFLFCPAFVMYTSDTYKDGFVVLFALGAIACAVRLAIKFSFLQLGIGLVHCFFLWYVRRYLVFAAVIPIIIGCFGLGSRQPLRISLVALFAMMGVAVVAMYSNLLPSLAENVSDTFAVGTTVARESNAVTGGSSVRFDDGGTIYGAFHLKLAYTLFAPFPWMSGTLGLHIGKIDALMMAYFLYRSWKAVKMHWATHRSPMLALLSFSVPMTIVYAFGVANMGLILRQRMPILVATILLGSLSFMPVQKLEAVERDRVRP